MSKQLLLAFALMLVLEGILPFVWPRKWREIFAQLLRFNDGQLRFVGLFSMGLGLILMMVFN